MAIIGFDEVAILRLKDEDKRHIIRVVKKNKEIYENVSHFIRASILRNLRRYDKKGRQI